MPTSAAARFRGRGRQEWILNPTSPRSRAEAGGFTDASISIRSIERAALGLGARNDPATREDATSHLEKAVLLLRAIFELGAA